MIVDKEYCMSSFLMFRTISDEKKSFNITPPRVYSVPKNRVSVKTSEELFETLKNKTEKMCKEKKVALCLSGGIDSAILAKFCPRGTVAYTFKCVIPGVKTIDETQQAAKYASVCGLEQRIIEMYWKDFENYAPVLMKHKNFPIHSIEVQIYKAALQAKKDGFDALLFGESADCLYGGFSGLLSKDWTFGEFVDRYSYVKPYYALKNPVMIYEPFRQYERNGYIDTHGFISNFFYKEGLNSYLHACDTAGIECFAPFSETFLALPLDLQRVRKGENKYLVRELFKNLYPDFTVPEKTPMPRPMSEWLKNWSGPTRLEFLPNCAVNMTGDQKWLVWALEKFLDSVVFPLSL